MKCTQRKRKRPRHLNLLVICGVVTSVYVLLVKHVDNIFVSRLREGVESFMHDALPEFYKEVDSLEDRSREDYLALTQFRPVLDRTERSHLLKSLRAFLRACKKHRLIYFLFAGSMMGAYRHHGLIPWDVDVDVMMHISQQKKVRRVLGEIEHFRLESEDLSGSLGFLRYRRPKQLTFLCSEILMRVNIFFFDENSTHVVGMSADYRGQAWPREFVFPLSYARFEQWMLPVPACVQRMLDILYGDNATSTCASYYLRFGVDRCRMRMPMGIVDCSRLYSAYPFVFRQLDKDTGYVIESRKVGDRTLDAVWAAPVPTVCRK